MALRSRPGVIVVAVAAVIFVGCAVSPPSLLDDVDAANAQVARNMLESGDWVTVRLNGVADPEKPPLHAWLMAVSFSVFGVHDWAARIPLALASIALCWLTARFGAWAFGFPAGFYAGLCLATCVGLFLFTRILIADAMLTLAVTAALWSFLRALDEEEPRPRVWAWLMAASMAIGFLLKGLVAFLLPLGAALVYLLCTRQIFSRRAWRRMHPLSGLLIVALIAAPWPVLASLRNPPYLDFTLRSEPGRYHGFFWLFFINEHLLRFLNLRYPRDYDTVPRLYFWLLQFAWLFPWSVFLPAAARLDYRPADRAGRARLLALCWAGFLLVFFSFSTTQEYYSMPCYPALALLIGSSLAGGGLWVRLGARMIPILAGVAAMACAVLLILTRNTPTPGDISSALTQNPDAYRLSLGHMADLTVRCFAYLRLPLAVAAFGFAAGALAAWYLRGRRALVAVAAMMMVFCHAARLALVAFDPYLSSRPLAEALLRAPEGGLIVDEEYYAFSSVFFYANRRALLLNGRVNDLEYGSCAPDAPRVFIDDQELGQLWSGRSRWFLVAREAALPHLRRAVGSGSFRIVARSGGKLLLVNQ
jgi:4-amino-4-deoxy-L-arabinose transferase-like glycosyltransferase